jgi:TM2 domain-containing membrane protein YozV
LLLLLENVRILYAISLEKSRIIFKYHQFLRQFYGKNLRALLE